MKFFTTLAYVLLLVGCGATQQVKQDQIKEVSILIDSTILLNDASQHNAIHLPINEQLTQTMFNVASSALLQKGYTIRDHALTVAATHPDLRIPDSDARNAPASHTPVITASASIDNLHISHGIYHLLHMHSATSRRAIIDRLGIRGEASLLITTHGQVSGANSLQVLNDIDIEYGSLMPVRRVDTAADYHRRNNPLIKRNYITTLTLIDNKSGRIIWQVESGHGAIHYIDDLVASTQQQLDQQLPQSF